MDSKKIMKAVWLALMILPQVEAITVEKATEPFYKLVCWLFGMPLVLGLAAALMAFGALLWISSRDEPETRERAKQIFIYCAFGLLLAVITKDILRFFFGSTYDVCATVNAAPHDIIPPFDNVICMILKALVDIGGALAALIFVWGSANWIMARQDPEKRSKAKEYMVNAVIGLIALSLIRGLVFSLAAPILPAGYTLCGV